MIASVIAGCGGKENATPAPSPNEVLQLNDHAMSACPDITGEYSCTGPDSDGEIGKQRLERRGDGQYHFTAIDESKRGFVEFLLEKYLMDDGGFIVNGKVQDKSNLVKDVITGLLNELASPKLRWAITSFAKTAFNIDLEEEINKIDIKSVRAGYVAWCESGKFNLQFVLDNSGFRNQVHALENGGLVIRSATVEDGGPVTVESGVCVLKTKEVSAPKGIGNGTRATQLNFRGDSMEVTLFRKDKWTLESPVNLVFENDPRGKVLRFDKAYKGFVDWLFDDVEVRFSNPLWKALVIDASTGEVKVDTKDGGSVVVGQVLQSDDGFLIDFNVPTEYSNDVLTLKSE